MKNIFLAISLILIIFFFSSRAISIIVIEKKEKAAEATSQLPLLGKKLFFDPILSKDGTVSCASCHKPDHAFSDDKPLSIGVGGQKGERNTPTVWNSAKLKLLFWDGRAASLEEQAIGPITNPKEMGETIENVLKKLNANEFYKKDFQSIFGESPITQAQLSGAISAFERILISHDSDYDRYISGVSMALSPSSERGWNLFFGKAMCSECHTGSDFTDGDFHNIGLPITNDTGRAKISGKKEDTRKFKTPTLREVALTAPYFHNGQFETLEQVVAFYNAGGGKDEFKDPLKKPLNLNEQEQKDLIEFLKALTGRHVKIELPKLPVR